MADEVNASKASAPRLRGRRGPRPPLALAFVVAAVLLYGVVYPNLSVVAASLTRGGAWTISNYADFFARRTALEATATSLGLSVLTVVLCAGVGVPLAFLFERYEFPGRKIFAAFAALPLVLPPLVGTVISIFKATAILSILAINDLMRAASRISSYTYQPVEVYTTAAALAFGVGFAITLGGDRIESRLKRGWA